jgi:hypothetical protein
MQRLLTHQSMTCVSSQILQIPEHENKCALSPSGVTRRWIPTTLLDHGLLDILMCEVQSHARGLRFRLSRAVSSDVAKNFVRDMKNRLPALLAFYFLSLTMHRVISSIITLPQQQEVHGWRTETCFRAISWTIDQSSVKAMWSR